MDLAENAKAEELVEEVESPGAKKRRELRAAIREALKKLRDTSIERRSPEEVSIADMFAYMRGLCNYLPQPKKTLFLSSEERVKLEYVILLPAQCCILRQNKLLQVRQPQAHQWF